MNSISVKPYPQARIVAARQWLRSWRDARPRARSVGTSAAVLAAELMLAAFSYTLAVTVVAESRGASWAGDVLRSTLALTMLFRLAALLGVQLYRRSLRHASLPDLIAIAQGVCGSSFIYWLFTNWRFPQLRLPAAVFIVDAAFLQIFWSGLHFGARVFEAQRAVRRKSGKPVVIVGAGDAGMMLLKELALNADSSCRPVAVVDDDSSKWGRTVHGVPIAGGTHDLARLAAVKRAEEILICIPSATRPQMQNILKACREAGLPVRTLPTLNELVECRVSLRDLRNPRVEDLLQRDEIRVDAQETRKVVAEKTVLVTGAGGSIGSELCRQIATAGAARLLLLDKAENSLFYVNLEAAERLGSHRVKPLLADVLDKERIRDILQHERPEILFHAAAHKHVGLLELHPVEAIRNNVFGTRNVGEAALEARVQTFVNISTDKAVQPRSYMGLSKKLAELCIQELARVNGTRFMNVRFGNVAGSTGSVLRLFWDQIQRGGPIRVSDPRATRYFMSVPEAVHLILRAAALGKGGETFVFDMGEPLNIYELAKTMALFAGLKPGHDLPIEFTGLREGEKISEKLWEDWEQPAPTETVRVLVIAEPNPLSHGILEKIEGLKEYVARYDREGLLGYLRGIVPDFHVNRTRPAADSAPDRIRAKAHWSVGAA